jgi:hypothetical protein
MKLRASKVIAREDREMTNVQREHRDVMISRIDEFDDVKSCFSRSDMTRNHEFYDLNFRRLTYALPFFEFIISLIGGHHINKGRSYLDRVAVRNFHVESQICLRE